jgi:adenylate kinase family enzyme
LVAGVPSGGKTTFARKLAALSHVPVRATDDLIDLGWSEASERVAQWMTEPGPWIIEGVAVGRALRKWFSAHPTGRPADRVFWLGRPHEKLTDGQCRMARGCETVFKECTPELLVRGVPILY